MSAIVYDSTERLGFEEWFGFLQRAELRKFYPKRDWKERITRALANAGVTVTARIGSELIGSCTGLTEFSYFLFLTDLSVAKAHAGTGVEAELVRRAIETAGGPEDITVISWAMPDAMPLYESLGIVPQERLIAKDAPIPEWFNPGDPTS